ncbi:transcriptional regulator, LacI family [Pilibacter termitis]|uniref:Transcriptional regulator, LacI family n=1 Tax=Pilibacter termitis TaxID=263852 RepID=A0A1T4ME67_9ENTE|nr:LacI family DNA-binding transcriptional regulator [Pilibacter termitis]SJZ65213.1 transcriptional regulator, LacI family [Pilibacter termitis]
MVTIKDIAKKVGVAPSTVSRVIQDNSSISEETKVRVRQAMEELGYVPNVAARNLVRGLTNAVGVIFPPTEYGERTSSPFFMQILSSINQEAINNQYTVAIATGRSPEQLLENTKLMYGQKRVDGFILLYANNNDPVREYLRKQKIPYVVIGTPNDFENETTYVDNDNQLLGKNAVDALVERGHERIMLVVESMDNSWVQDRYYGYIRGMRHYGLDTFETIVLDRKEPMTILAFQESIRNYRPTALIVVDDILSLRVIQLLQMSNVLVPDDISVISFNNSIYAKLIHPYITTFDIHVEELGRVALKRLTEEVKGETQMRHVKVIIPHSLKNRESVKTKTKGLNRGDR